MSSNTNIPGANGQGSTRRTGRNSIGSVAASHREAAMLRLGSPVIGNGSPGCNDSAGTSPIVGSARFPYGSFTDRSRRESHSTANPTPTPYSHSTPDSFDFGGLGPSSGSARGKGSRAQPVMLSPRPVSILSNMISGSVNSTSHPYDNDGRAFVGSYHNSPSIHSVNIDNPDPRVLEVVGRHLVSEADTNIGPSSGDGGKPGSVSNDHFEAKFDSLKLQGGDITRQLYNWQRGHEEGKIFKKRGRSQSFTATRDEDPTDDFTDVQSIRAPGGFRRNFLANKIANHLDEDSELGEPQLIRPTFLTRNFIEFLSIYGHFAGEELEEDDDDDGDDIYDFNYDYQSGDSYSNEPNHDISSEDTPLIAHPKKRKHASSSHANATATKAVLLLLKSFVGTGVLFLPKAFLNGGLVFSVLTLIFVALLSYWCFLLLIKSKNATGVHSFGDIGQVLYGPVMRKTILSSIVISQIGFSAAYIVFTSQNLQAFILAVSDKLVRIESLIIIQLLVFMPLSMVRNLARLSGTALIADLFILIGLIYLYYWSVSVIVHEGMADIKLFNQDSWALFIGTAIFTFEGIGLIIPIQESMKDPSQFGPVLGGVMIGIASLFISVGSICYMAFGSSTQTVVILNLPQDSKFVNGVQFLYSFAILLSTPLQLFPAIRIMENGIFTKSGKFNSKIKWQKNVFRFVVVILTALIAWGGANDLDRFVALIGSFACIPLVFLYPAFLHIKGVATTKLSKFADIVLIIFGFCAMIYTTGQTIQSWFQN